MDYQEARNLIQDGDLIAVRQTHGFLTPFTRFFTHDPHTHTGTALWLDGGLWMAELNAGRNHLIPLSQLVETDFDVYAPPPELDRNNIRKAALESLRVEIDYGFVALPVIGLLNWLRVKLFVHWRRILVCSGYCVEIFEDAGWSEHSRIISPADLVRELPFKFAVRARPTP